MPSEAELLCLAARWKNLMPVFGAVITGGATVAIGIFVAYNLNSSIKRTEFYVGFARRFGELASEQQEFNQKILALASRRTVFRLNAGQTREAEVIYRQYFTLLFDEYYAFRRRFLDADIFVIWMAFCALDNMGASSAKFELAGLSYEDAWRAFSAQAHLSSQSFVRLINQIHACTSILEVKSKVYRESPRWTLNFLSPMLAIILLIRPRCERVVP